ncbi:MAG TPA: type II toxin-antitoxin system RelE/ParE family toxin [Pseudolysinimonas sp.]|nr:type II toxin-antitoxin system RelE/ParE family toxin [Pseudolysinimonas sp.]
MTAYRIRYSAAAKRALTEKLPEKIATAAFEFIEGPLAENPRRLGKQLGPSLYPLFSARRGEYRVIYDIVDDEVRIDVVTIAHRRDAYR